MCSLYTDILTGKQFAGMQVWAIHRNISGQPLFPEKQLLFGYVGNEVGGGGAGRVYTLKEMALHSDIQTTACDM